MTQRAKLLAVTDKYEILNAAAMIAVFMQNIALNVKGADFFVDNIR